MPDTPNDQKAPQLQHPGRSWVREIATRFREALARSTPEERAASERAAAKRRREAGEDAP